MFFCAAPMIVIGTLIAIIVIAIDVRNRARRERPVLLGLCTHCNYPLAGLTVTSHHWLRCPECGHDCFNSQTLPNEPVHPAWWAAAVAIGAAAVAAMAENALGVARSLKPHHADVLLILAAGVSAAGLITLILAAAMTDRTKREARTRMLLVLSIVQLVASIIWTWWAVLCGYNS
ncbi:MAG: hypothetical protein QM783_02195 [Phycisphaerales bacterium]